MVGYTEVLQTMAAMIIFSMILLNANRMIQRNTIMQINGELEQEVVALAQDIIEEGRTKSYDEITVEATVPPAEIPQDFTNPTNFGGDDENGDGGNSGTDDDLNSDGEYQRSEFDDFDDYHGWKDVLKTEHGEFNIEAEVVYLADDNGNYVEVDTSTTFKKLKVDITSEFLKNNAGEKVLYSLEFIRNYYAD